MQTSTIVKSKSFPTFIKSHKIFTKFDTIRKIFPSIGLKNCSEKATIDEKLYVADIRKKLIKEFEAISYCDYSKISQIIRVLRYCKNDELYYDGKIIVPSELKDLGQSFQNIKRSCLYTYYNKSYGVCQGNYYAKRYGKLNISLLTDIKNLKVVFSSNDRAGAWDILTMSMRGIDSCQSWSGCYKRNLIGSIIDPYVGIIYLTNDKKLKYGARMLRRALVRYVINTKTKQPALLIERIYPNDTGNSHKLHPETMDIFVKFLQKKTQNKLPIITNPRGYSIPNSKIVKAMANCGYYTNGKDYCRSYRDSGVGYSKSSTNYISKLKIKKA